MKHFSLDIETLSQKGNAVVLSVALVQFDDEIQYDPIELFNKNLLVKFNIKEQIEKYNRIVSKETIEWWKSQPEIVKKVSFFPSENDLPLENGLNIIRNYINKVSTGNEIVWTRGSLDQFVIDDLCDSIGMQPLFRYSQYRDYRTAIDLLKETSKNGYCNVPNLDRNLIMKHDPRWDNTYDIIMLISGI